MSYANGTEHYNLPQTVGTDKRDWFDTNSAFAAIDAALYAAATGQAADAEAISTINGQITTIQGDITSLQGTVGGHTTQIGALQTSVSGLINTVADVRQDAEDMISAYNEGAAETSTHAYDIGDYFIYNDVLYKATAAIAIGDTIVPNTNCQATNVTTEIKAVEASIPADKVGDLADLTTTDKSSAVAAINEVNGAVGTLSSLTTTDKSSAVAAINEVKSALGRKVDYLSNNNYTELNVSVAYDSSYTAPATGTYLVNISGNLSGAPKIYIDSDRTKEIASYYADSQTYDITVSIPLEQGTTIYTRNNSNTHYLVKGYYAG